MSGTPPVGSFPAGIFSSSFFFPLLVIAARRSISIRYSSLPGTDRY
jgi:hypothetical protein